MLVFKLGILHTVTLIIMRNHSINQMYIFVVIRSCQMYLVIFLSVHFRQKAWLSLAMNGVPQT